MIPKTAKSNPVPKIKLNNPVPLSEPAKSNIRKIAEFIYQAKNEPAAAPAYVVELTLFCEEAEDVYGARMCELELEKFKAKYDHN